MHSRDLCLESEEVFRSLILRYTILFNVLCGLVAIPLVLLVIKVTLQHKLVHYNIKWILTFHLFCLVAHDIFRIIDHVWDVTMFLLRSPTDCYLFGTSRCLLVRIPINITMYLAFSSTFMLSLERCIATWKLNTYDKNRIVGPILVVLQVVCGIAFMFIVYIELDYRGVMTYCLITSLSPPPLVLGSISFILFLQIAAVITFEVLMKINKKRKGDLLCSRSFRFSDGVITKLYQVRENLRTMKTLMLFFLLSCVNSFCYNLLRGFVHMNKTKFSRPLFYALIEVSIHLPQFSLILPAVLWYSYRKVSRKAAQKHREKLDRDAPENTKLHFSMIAESWK